MADTYKVVSGDTLSEIAEKHKSDHGYSDTYAYTNYLAKINNLTDPDYIIVGQVLKLSGSADTVKKNVSTKATIKLIGLQSNTDRTVYVTWNWDRTNTDTYKILWQYDTGDGVWFTGTNSTEDQKQSVYNAPANALRVRFRVMPVSKTKKVGGKDTKHWTAEWSTYSYYSFSSNPPVKPSSAPEVSVKEYTLTATLDNIDSNTEQIQFQIVVGDSKVFKTVNVDVNTGHASYSCKIPSGDTYKVRCRAVNTNGTSDWTSYSKNVLTVPNAPSIMYKCASSSMTSVYLEWADSKGAETYVVEYTTKKTYFDGSNATSKTEPTTFTHYEVTGLTSGEEYFFRVRASNTAGDSGWSAIYSTAVGKTPSAPTTWSSTTTAMIGEPIYLYWVLWHPH